MRDAQSHFYHEYQNNRQDWAISAWAKKKGLTLADVTTHPCLNDISLLLTIQHEYEPEYKSNKTLYATYNALWSGVYSRKRGLNAKGLRRLETIVKAAQEIRQHNNQIRQHIKQLRAISATKQK